MAPRSPLPLRIVRSKVARPVLVPRQAMAGRPEPVPVPEARVGWQPLAKEFLISRDLLAAAKKKSEEARPCVDARLARLGFEGTLPRIERWLKNEVPLTINFDPDAKSPAGERVIETWRRDAYYRTAGDPRNGRSQVASMRGDWEFAFQGERPRRRPTYAALDVFGNPEGAAPSYGVAHLVLKPHVARDATISNRDSAGAGQDGFEVGTTSHAIHLLKGMSDSQLGSIARRALRLPVVGDPILGALQADLYLESQIYRPVNLKRDVQAMKLKEENASAKTIRETRGLARQLGVQYRAVSAEEIESFRAQYE